MKSFLRFLLRFGVSVGLIYVLLRFIPYHKVLSLLHSIDVVGLSLAVVMSSGTYILAVMRWQGLLRAQELVNYSFGETLLALLCGLFFNLFFPSLIASDVFRSVALGHKEREYKKIVSTVIVDRFSGMVGMASMVVVCYLIGIFFFPVKSFVFPVSIVALMAGVGMTVLFNKRFFSFAVSRLRPHSRLKQKLTELHEHLAVFMRSPWIFLTALGYSLVIQSINAIVCFFLFRAVGADVSFIHVLVILPLALAIGTIPVTIAGIGTREAAMVWFFGQVGVGREYALAVSLLNLVFSVLVGVIGGLLYVAFYHRRLQSYKNASKV